MSDILKSEVTAGRRRLYFLAKLASTGAAATGLTWAASDVYLTVDGGAKANGTNVAVQVHATDFPGLHYFEFTAAEVAALGVIGVRIKHASIVEQNHTVEVTSTGIFEMDLALGITRKGTAQAGAATTITLDASASAVNDFYKNGTIFIISGTGAGSFQVVNSYVGATKIATVTGWPTTPDATSVFLVFAAGGGGGSGGGLDAAATAAAVWNAARSSYVTAGTFGDLSGIGTAVWATVLEGSHTAGDLMRGAIGVLVGAVADFTTGTLVFKSLNSAKTRFTSIVTSLGRGTPTPGDLT